MISHKFPYVKLEVCNDPCADTRGHGALEENRGGLSPTYYGISSFEAGVGNFSKRSKYFQFCGLYGLCHNYLTLPLQQRTAINCP